MYFANIAQFAPDVNRLARQYCCGEYIKALGLAGVKVSMTQENHCYENAKAERLNGILKQEYGLGETFRTRAEMRAAVKEAVGLYNTRRPHVSLGYRTPDEIHRKASERAA